MKKIFQYSFAALAGLVLASCTGDYTDWASPQAYGPEDPAGAYGITAAPGASISMPVSDDNITLLSLASNSSEVSGYKIRKVTVNGEEIKASIDGNNVTASADELENALQLVNNSRAKATYPLNLEVEYGAVLKNGDAIACKSTATTSFTTSPTPSIDSKGYYLLGSFEENGNGWDLSSPVWMTDEGDGIYSAIVNTTAEGDNWFKFYEGSHYSADSWDEVNQGQMGCKVNGSKATQDFIVWTGDKFNVETPVISGKGMFKVTIDMKNFTYKIVRQEYKLYIIGGPNDWYQSAVDRMLKFNQADLEVGYYTIVFPAAAEGDTWFAIGDETSCKGIENGDWSQLFGTTSGNGNSGASGNFTRRTNLSDDGSFCVKGANGKYIQVTVDLSDNSYTVATLEFSQFVYFIGATDGWSKAEQKLATTTYDGKYTGYLYCADPNGWGNEFKFQKVPGDWDSQLNSGSFAGGISGDFADGGDNIKANAGEGVYYVEMDLAAGTLKATLITNMNLVGDFNGWNQADDAQKMTWNATDFCWEITGAGVTAAGWKFTANNAWDINLGGKTLNNLEANGDNITVAGSTIKLYPTRKTSDNIYCTVE
jgi:hypothetical protein